MIVYVDDFKLSGPKKNLPAAWETIRTKIKTSDPTPSGKFLGCEHELHTLSFPDGGDPWRKYSLAELKNATKTVHANAVTYNMESFLDSCVEKFCHLAKCKRSDLKPATTPFINEALAQKEQLADSVSYTHLTLPTNREV